MRHRTCRAWLGGTTALIAVVSTQVHAQDLTTTPLGRIVQGWGTDQVALDTPQATTVIDQTEIEQQQATTVGEFFDQVPGVEASGSERVVGQVFNIRGFGRVPAGDEGRVVVQQDGATKFYEQYRMGSFFADPSSFCNIEVLRGPASATLYGGGALGGVIRFETCDASNFLDEGETSQVRLSFGLESNGEGGNASVRYATMPNDSVELLFSATIRNANDYEDGDGEEIAGSNFTAASVLFKGTYHLDASRSVSASYEVWNSDLDDTEYEQTGASGAFGTVDRRTTDQTLTLSYENEADFGDLELTFAISDTDVIQDDASLMGAFGGSLLFEDTDYGYLTYSADARVTTDVVFAGFDTTLIYGATYTHQDRIADSAAADEISFHPEGTSDRLAVFAQAEMEVSDRLTLIPGVRLEYYLNKPADANASDEDSEVIGFSPKLAFTYDLNERYGLFGSIAQTERAPTLDELYSSNAALDNQNPDLDPETARSIELGVTFSDAGVFQADDALDIRATAFYNRVDDLIVNTTQAPVPLASENIEEAEIYGVELEAAYERERSFVRANYSDIRGTNLTEDEPWENLPQAKLGLTIGGRSADLSLEYGWRANFYQSLDGAGGDTFPSYQVHDVFLDWRPDEGIFEGTEIRFGIDNVFDETFRNSLDDENGRGRTFRITAVREF